MPGAMGSGAAYSFTSPSNRQHTSLQSAMCSYPVVCSPPEPNATSHTEPLPSSVRSPHAVLATSLSFAKLPNHSLRFLACLPVTDRIGIPSFVNFLCVIVFVVLWQVPLFSLHRFCKCCMGLPRACCLDNCPCN
jgi:hypothetical protein